MRAVLDTNVLISELLWRGAPHECLLLAEAGVYELVLAEIILEELRDKLIHKFDNSPDEADGILFGLRRCAALVTPTGRCGWVPADPDDDKFIESALIGHADVIVSGDHHLLDLSAVEGVPILTPRQFLQRLADESD
jgi:putative PIN family toxin of toxin-antitoxin system